MVRPCVNREIQRPNPDITAALAAYGVATIHEAQNRQGMMHAGMKPISAGWSISGPAVTSLNHPGDNLMVHAALDVCQPGDILIVSSTVECACGVVGDLLGRQAKVKQLAGLIIDVGVRDVVDLRRLELPIWTTAISASGAVKETPGWVNVPVVCARAIICPGDLIVADDDGVVVVEADDIDRVLAGAEARLEKEATTRALYNAGQSSMDVNNLRSYLVARGIS